MYGVITALVSAVACIICFLRDTTAGIACLIACFTVLLLCVLFTVRRYHKIGELSAYLQRLSHGEKALDIRDNTEGELSILKNEIYKATVALTEQTDTLRKDKAALSDALSDISHQLKTPLTALGIMADLLENDDLPPEKRREFVASLRTGLGRMEWLVLTLLKLAKLDADAAGLKHERTSLSTIINKAMPSLMIPMDVKDQNVAVSGDDAFVRCDLNWSAEALSNILKNAVENTPYGGHIEITYGENPLFAFITVRDSGIGISKADLPHLFQRFYRGKNASPDSVGIGLAMSLAVMREQNGDIEAGNDGGGVFTMKYYRTE